MTLFSFVSSPEPDNKKENYSVIYSYENFELRKYEPILLAEYTNNDNQAFSVLADFIFGGNEEKRQIPMTAPVITTMETNRTMSNNSLIKLKTHDPRMAASICFQGFPDNKACEYKKMELSQFLDNSNIDHLSDFELHVFDPPYKTFNRKNEIVVTLKKQSSF